MDKFRAYRIDEKDGKVVAGFQELAIDDLCRRAFPQLLQALKSAQSPASLFTLTQSRLETGKPIVAIAFV